MRDLSFRESEKERTESGGLRIDVVLKRGSVVSGGSASEHRARAMEEDSRKWVEEEPRKCNKSLWDGCVFLFFFFSPLFFLSIFYAISKNVNNLYDFFKI